MPIELLSVKVSVPSVRRNLVSRPRLLQHLDDSAALKLTLVSAPPGYGKTTLVTDWLCRINRPAAWFTIDDADNDPVRFFSYVAAALHSINKNRDTGSPLNPRHPLSADTMGAALLQSIASDEPFVIVLDDYHHVRTALIHETIDYLIDYLPAHMHLVILTREDPPLSLARLRASNQLAEVRERELRFTAAEAATFFAQTMGISLTEEAAATLASRTEGWIVGLQLAALSLRGHDDIDAFVTEFSGSDRYVVDYLITEVIRRQPADVRHFLFTTAILNRLTAPLCDAITGRTDSHQLLAQLERDNVFLIRLTDREHSYRYHQLFAEALRAQQSREQRNAIHRAAARWHEAHGRLPDAVRHAILADDTVEAGRLIWLGYEDKLVTGEAATVLRWLDTLSDEVVRGDHRLAIVKGLTLMELQQYDAAYFYADAAERCMPADVSDTAYSRLLLLQADAARRQRDFYRSIGLAQRAIGLLDPNDLTYRPAVMLSLAKAQWMNGDVIAAEETYRSVARLVQVAGNHYAIAHAISELAQLLHWRGRRLEAIALCQKTIERYVDARGLPLPVSGVLHLILGHLYYEGNALEDARRHIELGSRACRHLSGIGMPAWGLIIQARLQFVMGDVPAALATVEEAHHAAIQQREIHTISVAAATETNFHLRQGNVTRARRWADSIHVSVRDVNELTREPEYFAYVRVLLDQKNAYQANDLLVALERLAAQGDRAGSLIIIHVLQALTQQILGNHDVALERINRALLLAAPDAYKRTFLDEGPAVQPLLYEMAQASSHDRAGEFARILLGEFVDEPSPAAATSITTASALIEPLTERELEVLRLLAKGFSNREIALQLVISVATVKSHTSNIYSKLGVHTRTQAVAKARTLGL